MPWKGDPGWTWLTFLIFMGDSPFHFGLFFTEAFLAGDFLAGDFFAGAFFEVLFLGGGTFAPFSLASERPIAMACLGLVTFLSELPLSNVPFFIRCIALSTPF
jgi:hypothetical protein